MTFLPEMTSQSMTLPRNTEPEVTGVQLTSYSNVSETQDVIPGLKQECTKLVMELNREMAQYSILLVVVGGGQDSCEVREELKSARRRIFDLANQSMTRLVPVLKRSRVCSEEMKELERLYNMMSSCMDLFEIEMNRTLLLQRIFPDAKIQVKTGVFEFHGNCSKCQRLGSNWNIGKEEMEVLERDVADLHSTLDIINRTIALQPWADDSDVKVIKSDKELKSTLTLHTVTSDSSAGSTMVSVENSRKKPCVCIMIMILSSAIISGTVIGVCLAVL